MALPDLNLRNIRLHKGSQDKAFEELCCQLASLEPRPVQALHHRKGAGADAGVECFTRWPDGTETGWQVKFYTAMDASLTRSLDKSIGTALKKHPNLTVYIVCLPFDLSDARTGRAQSPSERWSRWRQRWLDAAAKTGRSLAIELWNESVIKERLGRDDPLYSGRLLYWFDQEAMTPAWFRARFERTRADLGQRYTPETNVQLRVRRVLLAFARDPGLNDDIEDWASKLQEAGYRAVRACRALAAVPGVAPMPPGLEDLLDRLLNQFDRVPIPADTALPVDDWLVGAREALSAARACSHWAWDQSPTEKDSKPIERADWARHCLMQLIGLVDHILEDLESERWRFTNSRQMLVYGDGGIGKSHLLADATAYQIERSRPALLLLGSKFVDGNPWRQILDELDLPRGYQIRHVLGALDAAAQAAGTRVLVTIDALNERHGTDIWPHRLAGLLRDIEPFPRVSVALSCRTTYLPHVIPASLTEEVLPRLAGCGKRWPSGVDLVGLLGMATRCGIWRCGAATFGRKRCSPT